MAVRPVLVRKEPVQIPFSTFYALLLRAFPCWLASQLASLVARLIKCEIPLSSFVFVNSDSNPLAPSRSSSSASFSSAVLIPPTNELFLPSSHPAVPHRAHLRIATPFLGRVRCPWTYTAADVDIAWRYRAERRADICLTLIGKCFDLLLAFSVPFLSRLAVGAR